MPPNSASDTPSSAELRFVASTQRVRELAHPNMYVGMMLGEFAPWAYDEARARALRGRWREDGFGAASAPAGQVGAGQVAAGLDLEIGPGNGVHFAHRARTRPERLLLGLELKFKPLVQSIRRAVRAGCQNARIARYDAEALSELFVPGELNDAFIHFPDPWPKKRNWKNRLVNERFLTELHAYQAPGSVVEFKTDSEAYFDWAMERAPKSPYRIEFTTRDLHRSERASENFITHFESLFLRQGLPIYSARFVRD